MTQKVKACSDWENLEECMPALITDIINMIKRAQNM
jgi:hypothetical protein